MEALPVAEVGRRGRCARRARMATMRAHLDDLTDSGRGEVAELLLFRLLLDYRGGQLPRRREQRARDRAAQPEEPRPAEDGSRR